MDIAVVIPCYNSADWVGAAVESALVQTVPAAEVIVVNDGSTDDSRAVLRRYEPRVRVIDQPNQGLSGARNSGVRAAAADWLAFLDADDQYEPGFVEGVRALHAAFPRAEMIFTDHSEFTDAGVTESSAFGRFVPELRTLAEDARGDCLLGGLRLVTVIIQRNGVFSPSTLIVRRSLFESVGGFFDGMRGSQDLDFYVHAAPRGPVGIVARPLVRRRQHPASLGRSYTAMRPDVEVFFRRAGAFCRRNCPELLPVVLQKYRGLLHCFGRAECHRGDYAAARRTFAQLVQAEPLRLRNWYALAASAVRHWRSRAS
jgi:glycosyltransferase involved in cell wall biosynthesis